jgi:triacylglycerol lipase
MNGIADQQAVGFGFLAMFAEDMYTTAIGSLNPPADARIAKSGWTVVAYLTAQDALFPDENAASRRIGLDTSKRVFFGFVAQNKDEPTAYAAVVRGTEGIVEWAIDGEFLLIPHPRHPGVRVEQGFWNIYQTMSLADPATGATTHQDAAEGIAQIVGSGTVTVAGHSLGSALATYLADDLAERLGAKVSACLFASPRTGDQAWANLVATTVRQYQLFNYILDIVTHVPDIGYATLPNATVIQPANAQAGIRLDVFCNHHVICYCAMIGYAILPPVIAADAKSKACIAPPPMSDAAKGLALVINEFGIGDERAAAMLKAVRTFGVRPKSPPSIAA